MKKLSCEGFTLIEMLVVITILGILASIVTPKLTGNLTEAQNTATKATLLGLVSAINLYYYHTGEYPDDLEDLWEEPNGVDGWLGPYLDWPEWKDAWGNDINYEEPGTENTSTYDIWSSGADGASSTSQERQDDITNWL